MTRAAPRARPWTPAGLSPLMMLELCACTAWLILAWLLSVEIVSPWWSVAALGSFAWVVILFMRIQLAGACLLLPVIVEKASSVVALALIAFGNPIPELGTVGDAGGHGSAFVVMTAVSFAAYAVVFGALDRRTADARRYPLTLFMDRLARPAAIAVLAIAALMLLYLLASGLRSGFPLLTHTDRFLFRRVSADKITVYILNFKFITSFILGFIAFALPVDRIIRLIAKLMFAALMVTYLLFGDKFFTMLASLAGLVAPYLYLNSRSVLARMGRYSVIALSALALMFGATWFIYSEGGRQSPAATMERVGGRMVGQGELWYLQYNLGAPILDWDSQMVSRNIQALTVKDIDLFALTTSIGPSYYSNGYAPDNIRASLHRNAGRVTYTASLEPLALHAFGWGGLVIVMMMAGGLFALSTSYLALAMRTRSLPMAVFAAYLFVQVRYTLAQGTPWVIFSIYSLKWLSVIALIELILLAIGWSQRPIRRDAMPRRTTRRAAPRFTDDAETPA